MSAYGRPYDLVLAHHMLLLALPAVVPALLVVLAVGAVVWRDRRAPEDGESVPGAASGGDARTGP